MSSGNSFVTLPHMALTADYHFAVSDRTTDLETVVVHLSRRPA